ncbi:hypothetical protein KP509_12G072800 [Ceratopteris richardii]|uniref:Uncharacterized protein n=1 Tax=Ceratopteris richardii TaxID=49495 RepID=A0A8T2TK53_CERRI|nr:hypothetical protein KP509_12G072800 [Ceratopteris richardii]
MAGADGTFDFRHPPSIVIARPKEVSTNTVQFGQILLFWSPTRKEINGRRKEKRVDNHSTTSKIDLHTSPIVKLVFEFGRHPVPPLFHRDAKPQGDPKKSKNLALRNDLTAMINEMVELRPHNSSKGGLRVVDYGSRGFTKSSKTPPERLQARTIIVNKCVHIIGKKSHGDLTMVVRQTEAFDITNFHPMRHKLAKPFRGDDKEKGSQWASLSDRSSKFDHLRKFVVNVNLGRCVSKKGRNHLGEFFTTSKILEQL